MAAHATVAVLHRPHGISHAARTLARADLPARDPRRFSLLSYRHLLTYLCSSASSADDALASLSFSPLRLCILRASLRPLREIVRFGCGLGRALSLSTALLYPCRLSVSLCLRGIFSPRRRPTPLRRSRRHRRAAACLCGYSICHHPSAIRSRSPYGSSLPPSPASASGLVCATSPPPPTPPAPTASSSPPALYAVSATPGSTALSTSP